MSPLSITPSPSSPERPTGLSDYIRVHRQAHPHDPVTLHATECEYPCDDLAGLGFRLRDLADLIAALGEKDGQPAAWPAVAFMAHHLGDHALAAHFQAQTEG